MGVGVVMRRAIFSIRENGNVKRHWQLNSLTTCSSTQNCLFEPWDCEAIQPSPKSTEGGITLALSCLAKLDKVQSLTADHNSSF